MAKFEGLVAKFGAWGDQVWDVAWPSLGCDVVKFGVWRVAKFGVWRGQV